MNTCKRKHITFGLSMISVNETWQTKFISFFDTATRLPDEKNAPSIMHLDFRKTSDKFLSCLCGQVRAMWASWAWAGWPWACLCDPVRDPTQGDDLWIRVRQVETVLHQVPRPCAWPDFVQAVYQYLFELSLPLFVSVLKKRNSITLIQQPLYVWHMVYII